MRKFFEKPLVDLKSPAERVREIDKELEGLNYIETRAKWEYADRIQQIEDTRQRLEEEKRLMIEQMARGIINA